MVNLTYHIVRMLVKSLQFPNRAFQLQYSFASFVHLCLQLGSVKDTFTIPRIAVTLTRDSEMPSHAVSILRA
jgi:hypothetical protein